MLAVTVTLMVVEADPPGIVALKMRGVPSTPAWVGQNVVFMDGHVTPLEIIPLH
jgi:prepilin-type processing-associated H-X9-DG protein